MPPIIRMGLFNVDAVGELQNDFTRGMDFSPDTSLIRNDAQVRNRNPDDPVDLQVVGIQPLLAVVKKRITLRGSFIGRTAKRSGGPGGSFQNLRTNVSVINEVRTG